MHWFIDPVRNQYADFAGRTSRKAYWMFVLYTILISIVIGVAEGVLETMFIGAVFNLAILIPSIAIAARRLHDTGKSGWWQLIGLIPILGIIILIVMLARKGDEGPNQWDEASAPDMNTSPTSEGEQTQQG